MTPKKVKVPDVPPGVEYTPDAAKIILDALKIGSSFRGAAHAAGVSEETFRAWRERHPEFLVEVKKALAELRLANLARIERAATKNWQAAAWILKHRFPDEFGGRS
jgi:hypothetical protein